MGTDCVSVALTRTLLPLVVLLQQRLEARVVAEGIEDRFDPEPFISPHLTPAEVLDDAVVGDGCVEHGY